MNFLLNIVEIEKQKKFPEDIQKTTNMWNLS